MTKVFINPGHAPNGNPDPGAVNANGARECDYALTAGEKLAVYLNAVGIETRLLQSDSLGEICAASNNFDADIFISIHCNAFNTQARGTETLYKSYNGSKLARCIQTQIVNSVTTIDRGIKERTDLYVLNGTDAVAALVEMAFIDNNTDLALMDAYFDDIVRAMARGITDYIVGG